MTFLSLPGEQCNKLGESEAGGIKLTLDPPTDLLEPSHLAISTPPSLSFKSLFKAVHPMRFSPCGPALTPPPQWCIPYTHRRGCGLLTGHLSPQDATDTPQMLSQTRHETRKGAVSRPLAPLLLPLPYDGDRCRETPIRGSRFYPQAVARAALQNVRNAPRIACAKVERARRPRLRSAAAASEDGPSM